MPARDDYRVLDFNVKGKGKDAEQVISSAEVPPPLPTESSRRPACS